jgi:hypothetical protein
MQKRRQDQSIMKRQVSTFSSLFSGQFHATLLGASIVTAPFAVQAHGGGSASFPHGGGPTHIGSGGFTRSVGSDGITAIRDDVFSPGGGSRLPHAPEVTQQQARDFRTNESPHIRIHREFDQLAKRGDEDMDSHFRRERHFRTRDFLIGLVDFGWPVDLVDTWSDAIAMDEIVVGMPSDLVLDYWGNPVSIDAITLAGGPAQIWTYRSHMGNKVKVTILGNKVTSVRRA